MASIRFFYEKTEQGVLLIQYLDVQEQFFGLGFPFLMSFAHKSFESVDQAHELGEHFFEEIEENFEERFNVDATFLHFGKHIVGFLNMLESGVSFFDFVKVEFIQQVSQKSF